MRRWAAVAVMAIVALVETRANAQLTTPPLSPPPERGGEGPFGKLRKLFNSWSPKAKARGQGGGREGDHPSPVEAAAARMRRDEAHARGRIADVQYLATMPCDQS